MAVIHKSRTDLGRKKRAAGILMILCWPTAIAAAVLTACFYLECNGALLRLSEAWKSAFDAWAIAPRAEIVHAQEWMASMEQVLMVLLQGVAWSIFGLTMAVPAILGLTLTVLFACLHKPSVKRYRSLRMRARAEKAALTLLRQLPDRCHLFLNRRLAFDGGTSEMDVVIAGPGGVAVLDLKNWVGLIEGCVTEPVLYRRRQEGEVDKLRNPARMVVSHVRRLSNYLRSVNVNAGVIPCVLFVSPEASVYVRPPEELIVSERRSWISSCIMADTTNFWELLGRELAGGRLLNKSALEQVVTAISKAPRGKRDKR